MLRGKEGRTMTSLVKTVPRYKGSTRRAALEGFVTRRVL